MRAAPIVTGRSPYSFEMRMRTRSPPMLVCTICRMVVLTYVGTRSTVPAEGRAGVALWLGLQVGSQRSAAAGQAGDATDTGPGARAQALAVARRPMSVAAVRTRR